MSEMVAPPEPVDLAPSRWQLPPAVEADDDGLVAVGGDLEPSTVIAAYRQGLFPMPVGQTQDGTEVIGWWSPHYRGVLEPADLVVSRSLRRSCRRYRVTINTDFDQVIGLCADLDRPGGWISPGIRAAYRRLHRLGWAHSVETWHDGTLVGGLYGIQVAGLFAGESMFHIATDASKVALVALVSGLEELGVELLDVQWETDHLASLGVRTIGQREYLARLEEAVASGAPSLASIPIPDWVAKSPRYLDRVGTGPMVPEPSTSHEREDVDHL